MYSLGSPALSGTTTVTVSILDLNDNAPEFQPSNFYHAVLIPEFSDVFACAEVHGILSQITSFGTKYPFHSK